MAYDPIPGVDVVVEKVPPGNGRLLGSEETKEQLEERTGVIFSKEEFTTSSKKRERFQQGLEPSTKFSINEFDSNFENLAKVVNVNAEALADLLKKKTILRENFVSNESTIANTNEKTLKEILIPADSVSDNGEVNLNVFITTSADSNNKTIRIKIGNQVLYDSSLALPSVLNPNNGKIMIELTLLKTSSNSGFLMGKSVIVDTSGDVTQPGIGTITNLDWSVDQALIITGQNSVSSAGQITLKGGKFNLPSPVTEYVRWQYATQNGNCVRRKIAYGSEVGGGPIVLTEFVPCPPGTP